MNFSISQMDSTHRGAHAVRMDARLEFDPNFVSWCELALIGRLLGRNGGPRRRLCSVSGCECEVQSHHPLQIVGQRMPQQHGARLAQASHVEALQSAVAQMRVGATERRPALLRHQQLRQSPRRSSRPIRNGGCHVQPVCIQESAKSRRISGSRDCAAVSPASINQLRLARPNCAEVRMSGVMTRSASARSASTCRQPDTISD